MSIQSFPRLDSYVTELLCVPIIMCPGLNFVFFWLITYKLNCDLSDLIDNVLYTMDQCELFNDIYYCRDDPESPSETSQGIELLSHTCVFTHCVLLSVHHFISRT